MLALHLVVSSWCWNHFYCKEQNQNTWNKCTALLLQVKSQIMALLILLRCWWNLPFALVRLIQFPDFLTFPSLISQIFMFLIKEMSSCYCHLMLLPPSTNAELFLTKYNLLIKAQNEGTALDSLLFCSFLCLHRQMASAEILVPKRWRNTSMAAILRDFLPQLSTWRMDIAYFLFRRCCENTSITVILKVRHTAARFAEILMFFNGDVSWSQFCYFWGLLAL